MKHLFLPLIPLALLSLASCSDDNDKKEPEKPDTPGSPTVPDTPIATTRVPVTVLDYAPMPGQFINIIPEYASEDTRLTMRKKRQ